MIDFDILDNGWSRHSGPWCRYPSLQITKAGVVLGANTLIVKAAMASDLRPSLILKGEEARILALLSSAHGFAAPPWLINQFRSISNLMEKGQTEAAQFSLALMGLPRLTTLARPAKETAETLFRAATALDHRMLTPGELMKCLGLIPYDMKAENWERMVKYDPNEPRDDQGRWTSGPGGGSGTDNNSGNQEKQISRKNSNVPKLVMTTNKETHKQCVQECLHLIPSPSGDLQASEYHKCFQECLQSSRQ